MECDILLVRWWLPQRRPPSKSSERQNEVKLAYRDRLAGHQQTTLASTAAGARSTAGAQTTVHIHTKTNAARSTMRGTRSYAVVSGRGLDTQHTNQPGCCTLTTVTCLSCQHYWVYESHIHTHVQEQSLALRCHLWPCRRGAKKRCHL